MRSEVDNCITFNQLRGQCQNHQGSEGPPSWQAHNTLRRSECASSGEISCPSFWKGRKFLGHNLWGGTIFGRNLCHGLLGCWFFCFFSKTHWKPLKTMRYHEGRMPPVLLFGWTRPILRCASWASSEHSVTQGESLAQVHGTRFTSSAEWKQIILALRTKLTSKRSGKIA